MKYTQNSERLVKSTADAMVSRGLRDAGYTYVVLDDCWMDSQRDSNGRLQADRKRFPSGIQNVIAYVIFCNLFDRKVRIKNDISKTMIKHKKR